ncbi:MAG: amidase [Pseudomonadota bacterium]
MSFDPATGPSARSIAKAIAVKEISSREITDWSLERLRPIHEACNAVLSFEDDDARAAADAADVDIASGAPTGPLHGVPLAHKDMFDRPGKIASWGARIQANRPAEAYATVLQRLTDAGAHQVAALHLTEFAFGPTGHNYIHGHARNPYDPTRITGGSSSGSACSVAGGAIAAALGSDTAGSLRLPAAACGIKSLKPTWTRVSRAGCMPLSGALDCVGPIARHVEDLALITGLIAGHDPRDGLSSRRAVPDCLAALDAPVTGTRIAIDDAFIGTASPEIQTRFSGAVQLLETAGCTTKPAAWADWGEINALMMLIQFPEVASAHGAFLRNRPGDYGPQVRSRIEFGHFISAADHQTALRARGTVLARFLDEMFADADVLALPVYPDELPTIDALDLTQGPELMTAITRVIQFTRPVNYLGLPAVTLPYPREDDALPNGFQLVGRPFSETRLLSLASAYEKIVPPVCAPMKGA